MSSVDPFDVLTALGVEGCTKATPVTGGWSTLLWKVERPEGPAALRLTQPGRTLAAAEEAATMRQVAAAGIPIPDVLAEGIWEDRSALLLAWSPGRTLFQEMQARPWTVRQLGYQMGQQQAALHAVRFPTTDTVQGEWLTYFGPVEAELRERIYSCDPLDDRTLHLDYHPLNIMVSHGKIVSILDWENAMPGEPRADVARTWSILRLMPLTPGRPNPALELARKLLTAGWLRGYQDTAGPLQNIEPFKVWAAEAMAHDLSRKIGQPGMWIERRHLQPIEKRINALRRGAGLPSERAGSSPGAPGELRTSCN